MEKRKKYMGYSRISQKDYAASLDSQKDLILRVAKDANILPGEVELYVDEKSGKTSWEREHYDKMMKILIADMKHNKKPEDRKYGWIICFKVDRLARNDEDFTILLELLKAWYEIKSATETIENTPTWRLLFRMLASFAVFESEKLGSRISLAQLHNLIAKNYKSLWGNFNRFGFRMPDKEKWNEKDEYEIVEHEAEVVRKIYEIKVMNPTIKPSALYKKLLPAYRKVLDDYLKWKVTPPAEYISRILNDDSTFRYNGTIARNLDINDELIVNYIDSIRENNKIDASIDIDWASKIWWTLSFLFHHPEKTIVNDLLYDRVKNIIKIKNDKRRKYDSESSAFYWLFENLIYLDYHNYEIKTWTYPKEKISKKTWETTTYYNYSANFPTTEKSKNYPKKNISDKKAETLVKETWFVEDILNLDESIIVWLYGHLEQLSKKQKTAELKSVTAKINIYWYRTQRSEVEAEYAESQKEKEQYLKWAKEYRELKHHYEDEKRDIENESSHWIDTYISLFNLNNFWDLDAYTKRIFFITFIDKIVISQSEYDDSKWHKIVIHPEPFIVEAWELRNTYTFDTEE